MIWGVIRTAIYIGLSAAEVATDVYAAGKRITRKLWPSEPEKPKGLSHKDVAHIQSQIRSASRPLTVVPPPKDRE